MRRQCRYRKCRRFLPSRAGSRGPQRLYCKARCRDRERHLADNEAGKGYQPKGRPKQLPGARKYAPGDKFGLLTLVEYVESKASGSQAIFRCDCGAECTKAVRNVTAGVTRTCDPMRHLGARATETPAYSTAHHRVAAVRGSAKEHQCFRCSGPAVEWAYSHGDPSERRDSSGKDKGKPYSTEPAHYIPLCKPCHAAIDREHLRVNPSGTRSLFHHAWAVAVLGAPID